MHPPLLMALRRLQSRPVMPDLIEPSTFTPAARRLGLISASGVVIITAVYAVVFAIGYFSLKSQLDPIADPWFSIMEILIILEMPILVALMVAVHAWALENSKVFSRMAFIFTTLLAGVTSSNHFVILTVSHQPSFAHAEWTPMVLSFHWPSIAYALDILAWDGFFAVAVLFAAPVFSGSRIAVWIRWLLVLSGVLALGGLSGVALNDMQFRNIGILGYVGAFLVAAVLMAILFRTSKSSEVEARLLKSDLGTAGYRDPLR